MPCGESKQHVKALFLLKKYEIAIPIFILANYAANAVFHVMEKQDPVRTSCADVAVVEKKMDKVPWHPGEEACTTPACK